MDKDKYEDLLLQCIVLAKANLTYYDIISNFLKNKDCNDIKVRYWIIVANNHFFRGLLLIDNLLNTGKDERPVSFKNYLKKYSNTDLDTEFQKVRECYHNHNEMSPLKAIRDKIIAHQELENIGDILNESCLLINEKIVKEFRDIVEELQKLVKHFNNPVMYDIDYSNALSEILGEN